VAYVGAALSSATTKKPIIFGWLGACLHTMTIFSFGLSQGFALNAAGALSITFAFLSIGFLFTAIQHSIVSFRVIIFPSAALSILASIVFPNHAALFVDEHGIWVIFHVIVSIMAFSLIALAALEALLMAALTKSLKSASPTQTFLNLPPLQTLETLLFQTITVATILLSVSIISGFVFIDTFASSLLATKTLLTILSWLLFVVLLIGRHWRGWRGRMVIRITLTGYAMLFVGFLGTKVLVETVFF